MSDNNGELITWAELRAVDECLNWAVAEFVRTVQRYRDRRNDLLESLNLDADSIAGQLDEAITAVESLGRLLEEEHSDMCVGR